MKKTLLILTSVFSLVTCRSVVAQTYTTAGQVLTIAAAPNTNSFCVVSNADGTVQKYFADRYNFWAGRTPGNGSLFDSQPVPSTGTNDIISAAYIQPWNSTNYYWVTATCTTNNSNSGPSTNANFVVPMAPIVFVLPPQPPQYVRVVPVK